jgi:DNA sulfur modification protein DndE|tara:strand:- start:545 stop:952 length:408 start_codon:yes stop_codon:yes gene_type:complete
MVKSLEQALLGTTFMSSVHTHNRLKSLGQVFGTSEDLISRLAITSSLKSGPISENWAPAEFRGTIEVSTGKSIRGKTMFKDDLSLFLVLLAKNEPEADVEDLRELFTAHWERGIEQMFAGYDGQDWVEFLAGMLN